MMRNNDRIDMKLFEISTFHSKTKPGLVLVKRLPLELGLFVIAQQLRVCI